MRALSLLVVLLLAPFAHAQQREIIRAPPPSGPQPAWLDNAQTRRFVEWQQLDRRWQDLKATRQVADFAGRASAVCLEAHGLPRGGEPQPGLRKRLLDEACVATLSAQLTCYSGKAPLVSWQPGFVRGERGSLGRCVSWPVMDRVLELAPTLNVPAGLLEELARVFAPVQAERRSASEGQRALAFTECERLTALRALYDSLPERDETAERLSAAESQAQLQQRWSLVEASGARLCDVAALHIGETRLELYEQAVNSRRFGITESDVESVERAREAFLCLDSYRDAATQQRALLKVSLTLRARLEKEEACERDPVCMEKREAKEAQKQEREERRMRAFEPAEQSCCKVCSTGKACGDSCISRSYTCHKGPGCACDG